MDTTNFIATTIQRIAHKRLTASLLWLGGIFIASSSCLSLLLIAGFPEGTWVFLCVVGFGFILCAFLIWSVILLAHAIRNPLESFFVNGLKLYGPLQQTIEQINREAAPYTGTIGSFVTPHWVISALSNSFRYMRLEDIVWIYERFGESNYTIAEIITVSSGRRYTAQIWSRAGSCLSIPSTKKGVEALLADIVNAAPWVTQGYVKTVNEAWMNRRAEFIAEVDRRRGQILFVTSEGSPGGSAYDPLARDWGFRVGAQAIIDGKDLSAPFGLNDLTNRDLIEALQTRQDRKVRLLGSAVLLTGFVFSYFFILPLIRGILDNPKEVLISREGIFLSMLFLTVGGYLSAFGQNGKMFLENFLFKNWWTTILFFILFCGGFMVFITAGP